ncbi:unnamed protein product [Thlaspi arvense]|uniref:Uncharacterized protein n=1 Tax=Thlaspi arvense TaxID=13288 RepID=A0AAU9RER5_THLAR|nr:unnamed protein product [Thlaspi arvense]
MAGLLRDKDGVPQLEKVAQKMKDDGVAPNADTYNIQIRRLVKLNENSRAADVVIRMRADGFHGDYATIMTIFHTDTLDKKTLDESFRNMVLDSFSGNFRKLFPSGEKTFDESFRNRFQFRVPEYEYVFSTMNQSYRVALNSDLLSSVKLFRKILDVVALKTPKLRGQAWVAFTEVTAASNAVPHMQNFPFHDKAMVMINHKEIQWRGLPRTSLSDIEELKVFNPTFWVPKLV